MIDTIHLRIHEVKSKYPALYEQFHAHKERGSYAVDGYHRMDKDPFDISRADYTRAVFYGDSQNFIPVRLSSRIRNSSWHYDINVSISHRGIQEGVLDVEFSVPKWLYGTNVFQLLAYPHCFDAYHARLIAFVHHFCAEIFCCRVDPVDVELFRVDLCYNQIFNNPQEAAFYLKAQSEQMKAWAHGVGRCVHDWGNDGQDGWSIKTDRYSFKCYHKGNEFQKHDYKKLQEAAAGRLRAGRGSYDLSRLVDVSSRMLRYEITFRSTMLHYLVGYNYFVSPMEPSYLVKSTGLWRNYRRADQKYRFVWQQEAWSFEKQAPRPSQNFVDKMQGAFLGSDMDLPFEWLIENRKVSYWWEYRRYTFDESVFKLVYDFFWKKVREAQVTSRSSLPEMLEKIAGYQEQLAGDKRNAPGRKAGGMKNKGGVHTARMVLAAIVSQYHDLREFKGYIPDSTLKALKRDFKRAGLSLFNDDQELPEATLDYLLYQQELGQMVRDFF